MKLYRAGTGPDHPHNFPLPGGWGDPI